MFNVQNIVPTPRSSTAVEAINVNPFTGTVNLRYTNGYEYKYSNVSRAKIVNLLVNPNMSLGFWVQELVDNSKTINYTDRSRTAVLATGQPAYELIGTSLQASAPLPF